MEILQTIWNVLITENERLTNIIMGPFMFIESYLYFIIFTKVLHIQYTKKQKYIYVFLVFILGFINILFIPSPYYTFINIILCPVLSFFILKLPILKACLCEITIYIVSLIVGTPLILLFSFILKLDSFLISVIPIYKIIFSTLFYILLYFVYTILPKNSSFKFFNKIKLTNNGLFILNFILGTLSIGIQFYLEFMYMNYLPTSLVLLSIFILLIYFISSLYSLTRTNKLESTTQKLEQEQLYNQTLTLLYDNIRGFKHDFNNIVQGIGGYISTNNMEGLKEYYSQILDDCQRVNNLSLLSPEVINNPAIYSLLTAKYHTATEFGIKINLEIFMDLSNIINMKIYELTRILGILIDNAIEAAKQCEEKEITITFRKDSKTRKQLFIIENTYTNKDVDISTIFEKGKTSKKDEDSKNHGLGLWEIRQILKKNKNLDLYTTKNNKYFKQQFEIYF